MNTDSYKYNQYRAVHLLVIRYNDIMHNLLFLILLTMGVTQVVSAIMNIFVHYCALHGHYTHPL